MRWRWGVPVVILLGVALTLPCCSSAKPSSAPRASAATSGQPIALSGGLSKTVHATPSACLSAKGGNAPVDGAIESDWNLTGAGSHAMLTWYARDAADRTVSLATYDLSMTMLADSHELNGGTGTVTQSQGGHALHFDVSFQDANDATFVVHAVGDVNC